MREGAFQDCWLLRVVDLSAAKLIERKAFSNCFSLCSQILGAESLGDMAFENCVRMGFVRALTLKQCAPDAFLNCNVEIQTSFRGYLADAKQVEKIDDQKFLLLKRFNFSVKQPENWVLTRIRMRSSRSKAKIGKLKLLKQIVEAKKHIKQITE